MVLKYEHRIAIGAYACSAIIILNMIAVMIYLAYKQAKLDFEGRKNFNYEANDVTAYLNYTLFALLNICALTLINRLKKIRNSITEHRSMFDSEIRVLLVILGVFSLSYLMRGFWN